MNIEVIKARVNWYDGYANTPVLEILLNHVPQGREFTYERAAAPHDWLWYAECGGVVSFFSYRQPGMGYGGARFDVEMKDGSVATLVGPWSSRAGAVNATGLYEPVMDVVYTDKAADFARKGCMFAGHVTLALAARAARTAGVALLRDDILNDEPRYIPVKLWGRDGQVLNLAE